MGEGRNLSYEGLFASRTPGPNPASTVKRQKYDFAVAYPDPESLPLDDLLESLKQALDEEGRDLAVYPHTQGYPPLREYVAQKLEDDRGIQVPPDDIVMGDGSSQPIHMLVEALIDPGDVVLTEDFVYSGTLNILRRFRADVRGVQCDDEGIVPDALESAIQQAVSEGRRPKMIYTIPTFQNPQGWTMTLERAGRSSSRRRYATGCRSWKTTATWTCATTARTLRRSAPWTTRTTSCTWGHSRRSSPPAYGWAT